MLREGLRGVLREGAYKAYKAMKAFLLAAGYGRRMGELTDHLPKPLLPVAGVPMISYALFQLYRWKIDLAVINLHYRSQQIQSFLRHFPHFPLRFSYEERLLGTAGALRKTVGSLLSAQEVVLLLNCDTILWPKSEDHPRKRYCPPAGSCLFLKPAKREDPYTKFSWKYPRREQSRRIDRAGGLIETRADGESYYIGYALVDTALLGALPAEKRAELAPLWQQAGLRSRLAGRLFQGDLHEGGDAHAYQSIINQDLPPPQLASEWKQFLSPWLRQEI